MPDEMGREVRRRARQHAIQVLDYVEELAAGPLPEAVVIIRSNGRYRLELAIANEPEGREADGREGPA